MVTAMQKKIIFAVLGLIIIVAAIFIYVRSTQVGSKNEFQAEINSIQAQVFDPIAAFIPNANTIVIAEVNGWPITENEMMFRKKMREIYDQKVDENELFNVLFEEKIKLSQAQKFGVLPTREEIQASMDEIKASMQEEEELKKAIELLMNKMQLSEEDYWQVYEYYNHYRFLAFNHYADAVIREGQESDTFAKQPDQKVYYQKQLAKYKKQANVVWVQNEKAYTILSDSISKADM